MKLGSLSWNPGIGVRIALGFLLVAVVGFYAMANWVTGDLRPRYLGVMEAQLVETAQLLAGVLEQDLADDGQIDPAFSGSWQSHIAIDPQASIYGYPKATRHMRVYVTNDAGIVVYDSQHSATGANYREWRNITRTLRGEYGARSTRDDPDDPATSRLHISAPIKQGDAIIGVVTVDQPVHAAAWFLLEAREKIIWGSVLIATSVVVAAMLIAWLVTRPIIRLRRYAETISAGGNPSLPPTGSGEIQALGSALASMRHELDGRTYIEHYVQSLTHEMKAPLSAIRGAAELIDEHMPEKDRDRFLNNIRQECGRMESLVQKLLELASLENREGLLQVDNIELAPLLERLLEHHQPSLAAKQVHTTIHGSASISGETILIEQALTNCLLNARDFTHEGSQITITISETDQGVTLTMSDQGPGIPDYAQDKVFDRFYSLPRPGSEARSTGLGLPFVRQVMSLHGGKAELSNNDTSPGAKATLTFPPTPKP